MRFSIKKTRFIGQFIKLTREFDSNGGMRAEESRRAPMMHQNNSHAQPNQSNIIQEYKKTEYLPVQGSY
jgi:hypothetical protein